MKKLTNFRQKQALMDQLATELQKLEEDQDFKSDLEFKEGLQSLMDQYGMSAKDTANLMELHS